MPENSEAAVRLQSEIFLLIEQQDKLAIQNQQVERLKQQKLQELAAERTRVEE